jgi:hypothetical protein
VGCSAAVGAILGCGLMGGPPRCRNSTIHGDRRRAAQPCRRDKCSLLTTSYSVSACTFSLWPPALAAALLLTSAVYVAGTACTPRMISYIVRCGRRGCCSADSRARVVLTCPARTHTHTHTVVFETFDCDSSGAIDEEEFVNMCQIVNAGTYAPGGIIKFYTE